MLKKYAAFSCSFLLCMLPLLSRAQSSCYQNPSVEGTSQPHVVPAPWLACYGSPDTQPGQWGFTQPASDGSTYVSFLHSGQSSNGYNEGMTQLLSPCMVAGTTYSFTVDLAHSPIYTTADPLDCYSSLIVYGGNSACDPAEVLWTSGMITNTNWQTYTITFTPSQNWCYLSFSPYFITACSGYINCMLDNISCVSPVNGTVTAQNVSCNGACDGSAWATPTSGTPPYTFSWSPGGGTNDTISNLCPGTYIVTITDSNNQQVIDSVTITQPSPMTLQASGTDVLCNGGSTGSATVTPTGGTTPYSYNWLPSGGTNPVATNLAAGTYSVLVTNGSCGTDTAMVTITQPPALTASISSTNPTCTGNNGSATVTPSGGTPTYFYNWAPSGGTNATANNLGAGTYTVTITDFNGCQTTQSVTLTQPTGISVTASQTNPQCNGANTGTATVNASGGTAPYTYSWSPSGGTNATATGLAAGTYTVTITDSQGCTQTQTFSITQPTALNVSATGDSGCEGQGGNISATGSGGTAGYTYTWSHGLPSGANQNVNPIQTTTYSITVTDANGCTDTTSVTYTVNVNPVAVFSTPGTVLNMDFTNGPQQICLTNSSTNATIYGWTMNGGSPSTQQNPCFTVPDTGQYCFQLIAATAQGCIDTNQQCLMVTESNYSIPNVFTPDGDGNNDAFVITNSGMKSLHCILFNRWGQVIYEWSDVNGKWDGMTNSGKMASDGVYYFVATMVDFADQNITETGFVQLITGK